MRFVAVFLAVLFLEAPSLRLEREALALHAFAQDSLRSAKHFLWKVEAPGGATAYLLGSLHVLTADAYPLPAPIDKAFADSEWHGKQTTSITRAALVP